VPKLVQMTVAASMASAIVASLSSSPEASLQLDNLLGISVARDIRLCTISMESLQGTWGKATNNRKTFN
jgi:hypothetical protein